MEMVIVMQGGGKGWYTTPIGKYNARISYQGKSIHLGSFEVAEQAEEAYDAACKLVGKPVSSYNDPTRKFDREYLAAMLMSMQARGLDVEAMSYDIIASLGIVDELVNLLAELDEAVR
jgi:hypothetical protein